MSSPHISPATTAAFAVVRRGFDREQVSSSLARLEAEAELLRADRDAAVERADRESSEAARARSRASELESRVAELGRAPVSTGQLSDRAATMLSIATAEADNIRDRANADADQIRADADDESWTLRQAASAELSAARERAAAVRQEHSAVLAAARSHAQSMTQSAERERARLDLVAAQHRDSIDQDHRIASDARRAEAQAEQEHRQASSVAAASAITTAAELSARRTIDDAVLTATDIMSRARDHVEELRAIRDQIIDELASLRARLEPIPGRGDSHKLDLPERPDISSFEESAPSASDTPSPPA